MKVQSRTIEPAKIFVAKTFFYILAEEKKLENKTPRPVSIKIEKELHICPNCGYDDGFHTSFVRVTKDTCKIILICPSCHARYDPDWKVEIHGSPQRTRKTQRKGR